MPRHSAKEERTKAIAAWASVSMLGIVIGPVFGGWLLEHVWWGAIFLLHGPFVIASLTGSWFLVPESRNRNAKRLDITSALLSMSALSTLVFAIIEAPAQGLLNPGVLTSGVAALVLGSLFMIRPSRIDNALIDIRLSS